MCALLSKLELMVQNPLYVNLQLTGLLSRLACYPQPLLKSLLLSNSLVFQPSVKSLLQVCDVPADIVSIVTCQITPTGM